MANANVSASDVFFGRAAPIERSFRNRVIGLIAMQEIGINIIAMPIALGAAALAGAKLTDYRLLPLLVVTFLATGVAMMTNNIIDAERDKTKWPLKPLATGLISKSEAILCTAIWSILGIVVAIVFFNWLILALGLLVLAANLVYSDYLRDNIGYLMLFLPLVLVPVAIWSGFSPETVLTPLPWILAILMAARTPIVQIPQEGLDPTIPAFFIRPRPTTERALYVVFAIAVFFVGVAIFLYAQLSWLFVAVSAVLAAVTLTQAKNLGDNRSREKLEAGFKLETVSFSIYWLLLAVFAWIK
ncbi:MAG TPA: UbiA family prenyltransferase [Candidatus Acidoferrales bacterium]|nr:UbiA family prenyltransferase [Candidatus Acidoferrales bacterium]